MINRSEKAEELFRSGYNCSQSVLGAFCDDLEIDFDTAMKISEGFGGGMGRLRLTCGAVSGMTMVIGILMSTGRDSHDSRAEVYAKVQELCNEFSDRNGSMVCATLLGLSGDIKETSTPEPRTEQYYKKRPCVELVKDCVKIIEEEFNI